MKCRLSRELDVLDEGLVFRYRVIQTWQVPAQVFVHRRRPQACKRLRSRLGVVKPGALKVLTAGDEGVDGRFAVAQGRGEEIDAKALIGLLGHVFGRAFPEVFRGDRRDVAEGLPVPLRFEQRTFRNDRPGGSPRPARLSAT